MYINWQDRFLAAKEQHAGNMLILGIRKPYNKPTKKYTLSCLMCKKVSLIQAHLAQVK